MNCIYCGNSETQIDFFKFLDFQNYNGFNYAKRAYICSNCVGKLNIDVNARTCAVCGNRYLRESDVDSDTHVCYFCLKQRVVNSYSYKPTITKFEDDSKLCIGVELETNGAMSLKDIYDKSRETLKLFNILSLNENNCCKTTNFVCLKRDGSIGELGAEVVSQPASLSIHKSSIPWETYFKKYQLHKRRHCGLHFHVDRNFFSNNSGKYLDWLINNSVAFISIIAGRKPNHYCYRTTKNWDSLGRSFSRYEMVNFCNRNTIEFRFFKSPKTYTTFMRDMEFTDAICKFIQFMDRKDQALMCISSNIGKIWELFFIYVTKNKNLYSNLYKYLKNNKKVDSVMKEQYLCGGFDVCRNI